MTRKYRFASKLTALVLVVALLLGIAPLSVFAVSDNPTDAVVTETENVAVATEALPAEILAEEVALRTENTKYFRLSDGTYQASMYAGSVHYQDSNGKWKEIDNTLKEKTIAGKKILETTAGASKVTLPESFANNQKATLTKDGLSVAFALSASNDDVALDKTAKKKGIEELASEEIQADASLVREQLDKGTAKEDLGTAVEAEKATRAQAEAEKDAVKAAEALTETEQKKLDIEEKNAVITEVRNLSSAVEYADVLPDTDIEYVVSSGKIKENIVIAAPKAVEIISVPVTTEASEPSIESGTESQSEGSTEVPEMQEVIVLPNYVYKFDMDLNGLMPDAQEDGSILLKSGSETKFILTAPYMFDAQGDTSGVVSQALAQVNGKWLLTLTADANWLHDENRVFPVVLDPTLIHPIQNVEDTAVEQVTPNTHFNTWSYYAIGHYEVISSLVVSTTRAYLKFSLPSNLNNAKIVNAVLYMKQTDKKHGNFQINAYPVTSAWTASDITWNNQPTHSYSPFDMQKRDDTDLPAFDITELAQRWYDGSQTNNGLMFASSNESALGLAQYDSSESSSGHPLAIFTLLEPYGLENWFTHETFNVGRAGTVYIGDYNRDISIARGEIGLGGANISRVYYPNWALDAGTISKALKDASYPYGNEWKINYAQSLTQSGNKYIYIDAQGQRIEFIHPNTENDVVGKQCWTISPETLTNDDYTLWITGSGGVANATVQGAAGFAKFYSNGYLKEIRETEDASNAVEIAYVSGTPRIDTITNTQGQKLVFTYVSGRLSKITAKNAVNTTIKMDGTHAYEYTYTYDSAGNLTGVGYPDSESVSYSYAATQVKLTDVDDYNIRINRTNGVVTKAQEYAGNTAGNYIELDKNLSGTNLKQRVVTDNLGNKVIKQFNRFGQTIATIDKDGKYVAEAYQNTDSSGAPQRSALLGVSSSSTANVNYLKNHNVESTGDWTLTAWGGASTGTGAIASTEQHYAGVKAIKLNNTITYTSNGSTYAYQTIPSAQWAVGQNYTFTAHVKIPEELVKCAGNSESNFGSSVFISSRNSTGTIITEPHSSYVITTDETWQQLKVSATIPTGTTDVTVGVMLSNATGTVYFDAMQLEKGTSVGAYNFAPDGDFKYSGTAMPATDTPTESLNYAFQTNVWNLGQVDVSNSGSGTHSGSTSSAHAYAKAEYKLLGTSSHTTEVKYTQAKTALQTYLTANFPNWNAYTATEKLHLHTYVDNSGASVSGVNKTHLGINGSWEQLYYVQNGALGNGNYDYDRTIGAWNQGTNAPEFNIKLESKRDVLTQTGYRQTSFYPNTGSSYVNITGSVTIPAPSYTAPQNNLRDARLDNKVIQLNGNLTQNVRNTQSVPVSASEGDTYLVGVWARPVYALPTTHSGRDFGFLVNTVTNGTAVLKGKASFDPQNPNWQYLQTAVTVPAGGAQTLEVVLAYDMQRGLAYFDGLEVQKIEGQVSAPPVENNDERQELIGQAATPINAGLQKKQDTAQNAFGTRTTNGFEALYEFEEYDTLGNKAKTIGASGNIIEEEYDPDTGLLLFATSGAASAISDTGINLVLNNSFEQSDFSIVDDEAVENVNQAFEWTAWSNAAGGTIVRTEEAAHTGDYGYKITRTAAGGSTVFQNVTQALPGEQYKLSAWFKVPTGTINGDGAGMIIEVWDESGTQISGHNVYSARKTAGDWAQLSVMITMPAGGHSLCLKPRIDGIGTAYVDDIVLEAVLQESAQPSTAATSTVEYGYNALGQLNKVQQAIEGLTDGAFYKNEITYEHSKIKSISHNGLAYNFDYDIWGNRSAVKVGETNLITYGYNTTDHATLNSITYANGQTIQYIFDAETKQVTGISVAGDAAPEYIFAYKNGLPVSVTDTVAQTITAATEAGIEVRSSTNNALIFSKTESAENYFGQVYTRNKGDVAAYDTLTDEEKAVRDDENERGISTFVINTSGTIAYSNVQKVDYFERVLENQIDTGALKLQSTYDYLTMPGNRATKLVANLTNKADGEALQSFAYTYDTKGNITSITTAAGTVSYTYDEAGQLTSETTSAGTTTWAYNKLGNVVSKTLPDSTVIAYTYDATWKDKLVSVGGQAIAYDAIGNPTAYDGNALTWRGRQLIGFNGVTFEYDSSGLRTGKIVDGVKISYTWHEGKLVGQTDGTDTLYFVYDKTGAPIGFVRNGTDAYWYLKNLQGDVLGIVDGAGTIVVQYAYDVWGAPIPVAQDEENYSAAIDALNPLRYRGYCYDVETQLYYCQSRYYNAAWGRWLSPDDVDVAVQLAKNVHAVNLWAYCGNNPVILSDESGKDPGFIAHGFHWLMEIIGEIGVNALHEIAGSLEPRTRTLHSAVSLALSGFQFAGIIGVNVVEDSTWLNSLATVALVVPLMSLLGILDHEAVTLTDIIDAIPALREWGKEEPVSEIFFWLINMIMTNHNNRDTGLGRLITGVLYGIGYDWDEEQQLWYTKPEAAWLANLEYHELYNNAAPLVWFLIDDEKYDYSLYGQERRIWLWKGNYGPITLGAECGYYYANTVNKGFWIPFDGSNGHIEGKIPMEMEVRIRKFMSPTNSGVLLFSRSDNAHWWLTGFKLHIMNPLESLTMKVTLTFKTNAEADTFYDANRHKGVERISEFGAKQVRILW